MIPQEMKAAVHRGLREAFGADDCEYVRELTGGPFANLVFQVNVHEKPFLLRINTRKGDIARQYSCMRAAADAGLAPRVWYTNTDDRVSITDYIDTVPLPAAEALTRIPAALRRLHQLPAFGRVPDALNTSCMYLMNRGPALDAFCEGFRSANILPVALTEELFARHAQLLAAYACHDSDIVSCHNDVFKPDNILFDGNQVWLVDWEAAFLNDRYADLAVIANMLVTSEAEERSYLREYFGAEPDAYQLARFFLMQQTAHLFYAIGLFFMASQGKPIDLSGTVPRWADFQPRFWAGEIRLMDNPTKILYGRVHMQQLLQNVRHPRYSESLRIVLDQHALAARVGAQIN